MVGFLEDLVGADSRRPDRGESGMVHGGRVDVHAADLAVIDLDRIDRPHALGDELGAVGRVLAEDQDRPLVALPLQGLDLGPQVVRAERAADQTSGLERRKAQYRQSFVQLLPTYSGAKSTMRLPYTSRFNCRAASKICWQLSSSSAASNTAVSASESGSLAMLLAITAESSSPRRPALEQAVEPGLVDEVAGAFAELDGFGRGGHAILKYVRLSSLSCDRSGDEASCYPRLTMIGA